MLLGCKCKNRTSEIYCVTMKTKVDSVLNRKEETLAQTNKLQNYRQYRSVGQTMIRSRYAKTDLIGLLSEDKESIYNINVIKEPSHNNRQRKEIIVKVV